MDPTTAYSGRTTADSAGCKQGGMGTPQSTKPRHNMNRLRGRLTVTNCRPIPLKQQAKPLLPQQIKDTRTTVDIATLFMK